MTAIDTILIASGLAAGLGIDIGAARYAREVAGTLLPENAGESTRVTQFLSAITGGTTAMLVVWLVPAELRLFSAGLGWLILALANIDFRTFLLPDLLNAAVLALGAAMVWLLRRDDWLVHAAGAAVGFAVLWVVELTYRRLRGRDGLGRGDAKLLGAIGLWVGATGVPLVLLIASLSGIAAALAQSARNGRALGAQTAIAFGPWIALGGFAAWILQLAAPATFGY